MSGKFNSARQISPEDMGAICLSKTTSHIVGTTETLIQNTEGHEVLFLQADIGAWRVRPGDYVGKSITAFDETGGVAEDMATITAHGYATGDGPYRLTLAAADALPTGLAIDTDYWVIEVNANTIQFASTLANAQAGTQIEITGNGTVSTLIELGGPADGATSGSGWANAVDPTASVTDGYGASKIAAGATMIAAAPSDITVVAFGASDVLTYWFE